MNEQLTFCPLSICVNPILDPKTSGRKTKVRARDVFHGSHYSELSWKGIKAALKNYLSLECKVYFRVGNNLINIF